MLSTWSVCCVSFLCRKSVDVCSSSFSRELIVYTVLLHSPSTWTFVNILHLRLFASLLELSVDEMFVKAWHCSYLCILTLCISQPGLKGWGQSWSGRGRGGYGVFHIPLKIGEVFKNLSDNLDWNLQLCRFKQVRQPHLSLVPPVGYLTNYNSH